MLMLTLEWVHWVEGNCVLKTMLREKSDKSVSILLTGRPGGPENPGIPGAP